MPFSVAQRRISLAPGNRTTVNVEPCKGVRIKILGIFHHFKIFFIEKGFFTDYWGSTLILLENEWPWNALYMLVFKTTFKMLFYLLSVMLHVALGQTSLFKCRVSSLSGELIFFSRKLEINLTPIANNN